MAQTNGNGTGNGIDAKTKLPHPTIHVTSHNAEGKAKVLSSYTSPGKEYKGLNTYHHLVYTTEGFPADLNSDVDVQQHKQWEESGNLAIVKPNGTVCRICDIGPGNSPMMHRTQSLDYGVVLDGEIYMDLDDGSSTLMRPGDVAVQRATHHGWRNASDTNWARMLFVLQDCQPLYIGGERFKEDLGGPGGNVFPSSRNDH